MSNEDFVSRQWLINEYHRRHQGQPGGALKMIEEAPAADVEPVRHGRWIEVDDNYAYDENVYRCSECGEEWDILEGTPLQNKYYYCPNCGAKLDKEEGRE